MNAPPRPHRTPQDGHPPRTAARSRARGWLTGCALALGILFVAEGLLSLGGLPEGTFAGAFARGGCGLWRPGFAGVVRSGPIPYRVRANAHGFRGPELRTGGAAAELRVAAIGDSMTDGFYVDDGATWPRRLEAHLRAAGRDVEVVQAARGGGSMDRFAAILERCVLPLAPDLVLVTFVSNDLADLGWFPLEPGAAEGHAPGGLPGAWFLTRTALGEALGRLLLGRALAVPEETLDDRRYDLAGGLDFAVNARVFEQRFAPSSDRGDGLAIAPELSPLGRAAFAAYLGHLDRFLELARGARVPVLLLYVPPYPEAVGVEAPDRPRPGKRLLLEALAERGVPVLDLGSALRAAGRERALHLAPLDFHLNPAGNEVVARAVADALLAGLVPGLGPDAGSADG